MIGITNLSRRRSAIAGPPITTLFWAVDSLAVPVNAAGGMSSYSVETSLKAGIESLPVRETFHAALECKTDRS